MDIAVALFCVMSTLILVYAANNLYLIWSTRKYHQTETSQLVNYPKVAIQLPVYNEKRVIKRLIKAVSSLDWPKEAIEIQILDDSTDETSRIIDDMSLDNTNIRVFRRRERTGYKAGALQYALEETDAGYVAIFDSDFLPKEDFLRQVIPVMERDQGIGLIQTRWGHINQEYNKLTRAIALALDWHHHIEQVGRNASNLFINFNGSCGVFRTRAIREAGGWRPDTLSEDLDISYRIQMKGWKAAYLRDVVVPGEIPPSIEDYRIQQRRWAKGSIQCSRLLLKDVLKSNLGIGQKIQSLLHLNGYSVYLWTVLLMLLSIPVLLLEYNTKIPEALGAIGLLGIISHISIYGILLRTNKSPKLGYTGDFLFLFITSLGLSAECSLAVLRGLITRGGEFLRTPKYDIKSGERGFSLKQISIHGSLILETLLALYAIIGVIIAYTQYNWGMIFYFTLHATGFITVILLSLKPELF